MVGVRQIEGCHCSLGVLVFPCPGRLCRFLSREVCIGVFSGDTCTAQALRERLSIRLYWLGVYADLLLLDAQALHSVLLVGDNLSGER